MDPELMQTLFSLVLTLYLTQPTSFTFFYVHNLCRD